MFDRVRHFALNYLVADVPMLSAGERWRSALGALLGLSLTAGLLTLLPTLLPALLGFPGTQLALIAPMGASAVILFALPLSPLAQPWSVLGGYLVAAGAAVACAWLLPHGVLAAALAVALTIGFSSRLRCLHPPSGALAILIVFDHSHSPGHTLELVALAIGNVLALVLAALLINRGLLQRRYPLCRSEPPAAARLGREAGPAVRIGLTHADLSVAMKKIDGFLDVQDDDLLRVYRFAVDHAFERHLDLCCGDLMHCNTPTLEFASELQEAWDLLQDGRYTALPVLDRFSKRLLGVVTIADFLQQVDATIMNGGSLPTQLRSLLKRTPESNSEKAEVVGQIMSAAPLSASPQTPVIEVIGRLIGSCLHQVPVVDERQRFVGMLSQADLIATLYQQIALLRSRSKPE